MLNYLQFGLVLVGLSSVLRDNHQGSTQGQVVLGKERQLRYFLSTYMYLECSGLENMHTHPKEKPSLGWVYGYFLETRAMVNSFT